MSEKTRIKRPTTSTPRKNPPGRMIHTSTNYLTVMVDGQPKTLKQKGTSYGRRS